MTEPTYYRENPVRAWLARWGVLLLGLALLVAGGVLMYQEPPILDAHTAGVHKLHYECDAGLIAAGLLLLVPSQLAEGIGQVASAIGKLWRSAKGGTP